MKFILQPPTNADRGLLGGKAAALAELDELPVPPWFVVTPAAYHNANGVISGAVADEIVSALKTLCPRGALVAVRSSAVDEDGAQHSFAGQLESFLNVAPANVPATVARVWQSAFSERLRAYRREHGLPSEPNAPAVLVQRMVNADVAGVAFSADPVSGRRSVAVVSAVRGLGEKLVSGEANADTFHVSRDGEIISRQCSAAPLLTDLQVQNVAALARAAAKHFGRPQDIEWAIADGQLWLLQSRAITTLASLRDSDGELRIWDNSNIAESYGGITTPLTYSFARRAYEEVYRQFCRLMRVPERTIKANDDTFRSMIGLVRGRVYYNLVNWHRVLAMLPGYAMNRPFMEQMMGVKEPLPAEAVPPPAHSGAKWRDALHLAQTVAGLVWNHVTLKRQIASFYKRLNTALAEPRVPLTEMRPEELAAHYRDLERQLLTRWDAPLVNDFFAMIFHGVLRKLCARAGNESLANELIRDSGEIISAEPARRMKELAALAAPHEQLVTSLREGSPRDVRHASRAVPEFASKLNDYLRRFGDRCLDELKLESATLDDDATPLFRAVAALAGRTDRAQSAATSTHQRAEGSARHGLLFTWVLRHTRARVRDRENLRFERTRLFGRVRRIFVELGKRLHSDGHLEHPRDIFFLDLNEALGFVDGTTASADLKSLVTARRNEFAVYADVPAPADRFETRGAVHHANPFQASACLEAIPASGDTRTGLACCAGIVRGRVRVITDARDARIEPGEILVAERTDPGWIMLFPAAAGVLVERGSLLSHAAIVSRELGLPGIVSISGLTAWLQTGDVVEMDGSTGVARKII
jgi:rifampicin phosphotransferase